MPPTPSVKPNGKGAEMYNPSDVHKLAKEHSIEELEKMYEENATAMKELKTKQWALTRAITQLQNPKPNIKDTIPPRMD